MLVTNAVVSESNRTVGVKDDLKSVCFRTPLLLHIHERHYPFVGKRVDEHLTGMRRIERAEKGSYYRGVAVSEYEIVNRVACQAKLFVTRQLSASRRQREEALGI